MKIPGFEGTPEEFHDFVNNHGFDPNSFFRHPENNTPPLWALFLTGGLYVLVVLLLVIVTFPPQWKMSIIIICLVFLIITIVLVQLKFSNFVVTSIVALGLIILISLGLGISTPEEAIQDLKENLQEKTSDS